MRHLRTLAAISAVTALTAAPVAAAAPSPAPSAPTAPAALQPATLVQALRQDLGLTPEQFLAQASVGERLSRASADLQRRFADSFGGVWMTDTGVGTVGVAPGAHRTDLRRAAAQAGFATKDVALTAAETDRLRDAAEQPGAAGKAAQGSLAALARTAGLPPMIAELLDSLLANAPAATGSIIDGMNTQVPDPARTVTPEQRHATQPVPETGPVPGGSAFDSAVEGGVLQCSTGFNGELDGRPVVITAAHCAGRDGTRVSFPGGAGFGTFTHVLKQDVDSAIIAVDSAVSERFRANTVGTSAAGATPATTQAITGTAKPVAGQKVCKSGARTGYSCGTVSQVGATIDVAGKRTVKDGFTVDLCALPGDSGGVVFAGDRALGISSASNVADAPDCAQAEATARQAEYTPKLSAVPIDDVLAAQPGLKLRTS